jgi:ferrous iron transport protein B
MNARMDTSHPSSSVNAEAIVEPLPHRLPAAVEASSASEPIPALRQALKVALAGNPNVGKSVFFNAFTGHYVNVSNFPGTTVDIASATLDEHTTLQDTPGVYGLSGMSEEETVAEKSILAADIVVNVVSAMTLERDLFLTQQMIDWGKPLIVAVNQMDEAEARGRKINLDKLSKLLGVPVFPTVATSGKGMALVRASFQLASHGHATPDSPEPHALRELEKEPGQRLKIYGLRRAHINTILRQVVQDHTAGSSEPGAHWTKRFSQQFGALMLNPIFGGLSLIVVLLALYQIVGVWVAGDLVDLIEGQLMLGAVIPAMNWLITRFTETGSIAYQLLGGEFGVLTMSVQYIFGVLFPLVLGFYIYLSILEDCGYLPRVAVLADGALSRMGLNGRAIIPLILGLGCVTMATVSTRVLTSQRERTIASVLLAITIPCSAQLGVMMGVIGKVGGLRALSVYAVILAVLMIGLGTVLNKILPGRSSSLVLDLPPMRLPSIKNVAKKTWIRTASFLQEAAPLFMLGSAIVAVLQTFGLLTMIEQVLSPVTQTLLHLPSEAARMFIMGMVRRDFGVAGLYGMADHMSAVQVMTSLVVITLFVPCIASATVIWKERGLLESGLILIGSWGLAFVVGIVLTRLMEFLPVL